MAQDSGQHPGAESSECSISGCGEIEAVERVTDTLADAIDPPARRGRLFRTDQVDGDTLERVLTARGRERRSLLRAGGLLAGCAAAGPLFATACATPGAAGSATAPSGQALFAAGGGRVHTVESSEKTVHLGVLDTTLPDI